MEKKLTDEEIVKALECCMGERDVDCENCPLNEDNFCSDWIIERCALDLIHRLQEDKARLIDKLKEEEGWYKLAVDGQKEALAQAEMYKENLKNEKKWGKIQVKQVRKETVKDIFGSIFEALCVFTTQGENEEYNKWFLDAVSEIEKRLQKLAKDKGVEVE